MKKQIIALTLLLGIGAHAGEKGFQKIFNGKDLTGWAGPVGNYQVVDGTLRCKPGKGGTIYTKEVYSDFVVRMEILLPEEERVPTPSSQPARRPSCIADSEPRTIPIPRSAPQPRPRKRARSVLQRPQKSKH